MQKTYQYLDIDINKKIHRRLRAVQGDTKSRYILVNLFENSKSFNLSNCSIKIFGIKSDKKIFFNFANILDAIKGKFEIELTTQALAAEGELEIQLLILGGDGERLTSFKFYIDIEKSIVDDAAIESTNEFTALTNALGQVQNIDNRFENVNSQLETKANKEETMSLKNQVDNLILGATGDGNNPEIVASRGTFSTLPNRLDNVDNVIKGLVNNYNTLTDKTLTYKSWTALNGDYTIINGTNFCNAIKFDNGAPVKGVIYQDVPASLLSSGNYNFALKCKGVDTTNLFLSLTIVGYPTSVSSGGTTLYSKVDFRAFDASIGVAYQNTKLNFDLSVASYHHCRIIIELRTLSKTYNISEIYLGINNTISNDFSYFDSKFSYFENTLNNINAITTSKLKNKTLYLNGDSITFGAGYSGGYGKLLSDKYGCINTNNAISGGTLATGTTYGDGKPRHYISSNVVSTVTKAYDYMILSGGFNDYGNNVPIGTLSNSEFNFTNPVTTDNVIGALETMFRHILQNYPTTKVYFLITHKANRSTNQANSIGKTMQDYVNAIKSVCEMYSIPIINVWENSRMITVYDNIANTYTLAGDRVHPNQLGYEKFYLPVIENRLNL